MAFSFTNFLKGLVLQNEVDRSKQLILQSSASATTGTSTTITAAQTVNRTLTLPDITDTVATVTGNVANITATSNSTLTSLPSLSLPGTQVTGNISGNATNITATSNSTLTTLSALSLPASQLTSQVSVPNGGTGDASFTANQVVLGGTTSTGALQQVPGGTSTYILTSNGPTAAPTWQVNSAATGTSTPTANTNAQWDGNVNMSANNFIAGWTSTATAGSNTTLTVTSSKQQMFTGSSNQNVILPAVSTLVLGQEFEIMSLSSGTVSIYSSGGVSGGNNVVNLIQNQRANVKVLSTSGTAAGSWFAQVSVYAPFSNPMTTLGDTIVGASSGTPARLAVGTNGQYLGSDSTATDGISWQNPGNSYNFLVNGALDYWQAAGTGFGGTAGGSGGGTPVPSYTYFADQWYINNILGGSGVQGVISYQQNTGGVLTGTSKFEALVYVSTAPTGSGIGSSIEIYQTLSNLGSLGLYGQTASFSAQIQGYTNTTQVGIQFCYATTEVKPTTFIGSEHLFTVNNSSPTLCAINGQALGTSQTTNGVIGVRIRLTGVSSGNIYDVNNGIRFQQCMLNLGPVALPFERQNNDPAQEFAACQYFFATSYDLGVIAGSASAATPYFWRWISSSTSGLSRTIVPYSVPMRASASVTTYSPTAGGSPGHYDLNGSSTAAGLAVGGTSKGFWIETNPTVTANLSFTISVSWTADARI